MPGSLGPALFRGRQLHSRDYRTVDEFTGTQVIVVGGGISVLQHLDESQTMPSKHSDSRDVEIGRVDVGAGGLDELRL
jgi:cation diffusion facilitator CzcD-associated flavoprotein CzcO